MEVESLLKELLGEHLARVSEFSLYFLRKIQDKGDMRDIFNYLLDLGVKPYRIAVQVKLLGLKLNRIKIIYNYLRGLGFSN